MAATIIQFANLPRRRTVVLKDLAVGLIERLGQNLHVLIPTCLRQMFQRSAKRQELAQRIPAQIAFVLELLHMLGRRTAGPGLEQPAARQQRNDRQHLGRRAQLHDREKIGQVVAQHIASDGDGVEPLADAIERELDCLDRRQDADVETRCVLVLQVCLDLGDQLRVVRAFGVEPEHRWGAGQARAAHPKLDPVPDRRVLDLAHPEDVTGLDRL